MKQLTEINLYRDAANVLRYHTKRTLRQQTVGAHTFDLMMLVQTVAPDCRKEVLLACMKHDLPELFTGDLPAPIKRADPELAMLLEAVERGLYPLYEEFNLTEEEEALVKWADRMELVLWCLEEHHLGNKYVVDTIRRGMGWILAGRVPTGCQQLTDDVVRELRSRGLSPAAGAELEMKR